MLLSLAVDLISEINNLKNWRAEIFVEGDNGTDPQGVFDIVPLLAVSLSSAPLSLEEREEGKSGNNLFLLPFL